MPFNQITRHHFTPPILLLLLFFSCTENPVRVDLGVTPEASELIAPALVYNLSPRKHVISVKVVDPQGVTDISQVTFTIAKVGSSTSVLAGALIDDGTQGDIIPKDGVFATQITGSFAGSDVGDFRVSASAQDRSGNASDTLEATISVQAGTENLPPEILTITAPAAVPIDSSLSFLVPISVTVSDAEGLADIQRVVYQFFAPASPNPAQEDTLSDTGANGDQPAGDGVYSTALSSNLFKKTTDHLIRLQAEDRAGNTGAVRIVSIRGRFQILDVPVIQRVNAPEIVNANVNPHVLITAGVSDPQGLADLQLVQFRIFQPGGQEAPDSPQIMFDDGSAGDVVAGDGIFSGTYSLPNGNSPIDLKLVFEARDQSQNLSRQVEHTLTVAFDDAPYISNLVAPSQASIDPQNDLKILITLKVKDPQGLADIDTVQFRSFLPSGQEANNSPIQLFDTGDGDVGDDEAGDGVFSRFIFLPSQGVTPGNYRFVFQVRDKANLLSNIIEHILMVSQ